MNRQIVLISCVKQKRDTPCRVRDMYTSPLFSKMLRYAVSLSPREIHVLSAQFGLLDLDEVIDPYEKTLNTMKVDDRQRWASRVLAALAEQYDLQMDHFVILAGIKYREFILPGLSNTSVPLEGLPLGMQLNWLEKNTYV